MQKNSNNINEAQFLQKMFKFFDIQNKGKVDFDQWYRAMEKVGIVMDRPVSISYLSQAFCCRIYTKCFSDMMSTEMETWTTKNSQACSWKESSHRSSSKTHT